LVLGANGLCSDENGFMNRT